MKEVVHRKLVLKNEYRQMGIEKFLSSMKTAVQRTDCRNYEERNFNM